MEFSNKVYKKHSMCRACIIRSSNIVDNLRAGQNIQEAFTVVGTASLSVVGTTKPSISLVALCTRCTKSVQCVVHITKPG